MNLAYADPPYIGCAHLYTGTGAVTEAWRTWRGKFALPTDAILATRNKP